ncbi:MAG: TonB-dependent receptor [Sphingomonadales bacterium 12-68-11]|nr:MAG: TonB-dependent receptor [Sphingomonadales bacterium 12-68-11]
MRSAWWIGIAAISLSAPAYAQSVSVDVPAGRAGDAAIALAHQTGASIVITDRALADRRVPAIRTHASPSQAVALLARAARARAVATGSNSWRLVALAPPRPFVQPRARSAAPRPDPSLSAAPLAAQGEDIVVTASKRDTALSEFAGQVSMVDGEELMFGGVGGTDKIIQRVPTVSSTYLGSGRNKLFIRGIADSSFTGPTQSTVGQYIGDLRLSYNAPDPDLRLSDLARVEVLEGPQGTLYGAGSLGGIVRLVPNEPVSELVAASGMIGGSATQHGAAGGDASLTANLPLLGDRAALRFTVNAETQGGYIDKPALGREDVNRTEVLSGRAAARFEVGAGWTVDLIGIAQQTDGADSQYADRDGPPLTRASTVTEGYEASYRQGQLVVTGQLGEVLFKSSTGVTGQNLEERYDATLPALPPRLFVQQNDTDMVANETRIWQPLSDRFGWLAGVSFTHNRTRLTRTLGPPDALNSVTGVTNVVDETTAFAEGTLRVSGGVTATAGGRYTRTRLSGEGEDVAPLFAAAGREVTMSRVEDVFLPSASLAASVLPDTTVFVRYQEGLRPGGLAIAGNFLNRFSNDHIATFELGARRGRSRHGALDLAASVSYTRWNDIQADFIDSAGFPSTANIGDGRIWTVTASAGVRVTPNLRIDGGFTYNDSRIEQPSPILLQNAAVFLGVPVFTGGFADLPRAVLDRITQVPNVADLSGRIGFDYWRPLGRGLELTVQGWATYIGSSRLGIGPELGEEQGDYVDTGLTVRIGRQALGLTLGLTNLTDEEGNRFALGTPFTIGRSQVTPLRPRTIRIGIDAAF